MKVRNKKIKPISHPYYIIYLLVLILFRKLKKKKNNRETSLEVFYFNQVYEKYRERER
jgi:hypothetical protein